MKQLTINLPDDVYSYIELRAAIDDLRASEGVEALLVELVRVRAEKRQMELVKTVFKA